MDVTHKMLEILSIVLMCGLFLMVIPLMLFIILGSYCLLYEAIKAIIDDFVTSEKKVDVKNKISAFKKKIEDIISCFPGV